MKPRSLDDLALGDRLQFEELVDRTGLTELARSFYDLFRVPLKIFSASGALLADVGPQPEIYKYLSSLQRGRHAVTEVVSEVKSIDPGPDGEVSHQCFTGGVYQVTGVRYDGRRLGRMVLGPFLPPTVSEVPRSILDVDPEVDPVLAKKYLQTMARARPDTVAQIARHLRTSLDLILFSGHKALLTSNMHLASVRESFRDLQEKNERLQEAYDRLKELDRLKSNFLATVSHELRTPLTSIIGYSEMLVEGIAGPLAGEQREFVGTIHEKGEQLLDLITGLLDLSKLESGTLSTRKEDVDVAALVTDVTTTLTPASLKRGISLAGTYDGKLPALWGDATRLRQVLLNLTENAIKFTPEGGTVEVSAHMAHMSTDENDDNHLFATKEPCVEFRVRDTGIGIADAEKERVFDAFYQVDSSSTRAVGGTGLGLSIVRRLVESHRGTVQIEDNQPTGTVFIVRIPFKRATLAG